MRPELAGSAGLADLDAGYGSVTEADDSKGEVSRLVPEDFDQMAFLKHGYARGGRPQLQYLRFGGSTGKGLQIFGRGLPRRWQYKSGSRYRRRGRCERRRRRNYSGNFLRGRRRNQGVVLYHTARSRLQHGDGARFVSDLCAGLFGPSGLSSRRIHILQNGRNALSYLLPGARSYGASRYNTCSVSQRLRPGKASNGQ
jgi:hypothetical protein